MPLCVLFSKIFSATTYDCPVLQEVADELPEEAELIQVQKHANSTGLASRLNGTGFLRRVNTSVAVTSGADADEPKKGDKVVRKTDDSFDCKSVRRTIMFTGLTCST